MFEYGKKRIKYSVTENGCFEHNYIVSSYKQVIFNKKLVYLHRLVFIMEKNKGVDIQSNIVIRHTCDNPKCINPEHLISGTQDDNIQDAVKKGRMRRGNLTDNDIKIIRLSFELGIKKQAELAEEYRLTRAYVNRIINFKLYKNVY